MSSTEDSYFVASMISTEDINLAESMLSTDDRTLTTVMLPTEDSNLSWSCIFQLSLTPIASILSSCYLKGFISLTTSCVRQNSIKGSLSKKYI